MTAAWRSHATLGLRRSVDRISPAPSDSSTLFRVRRSPTFHRRWWPRA